MIQKTTGTLSPGAHPGSYNGQDAYNDMLVVDYAKDAIVRRGGEMSQTLDASYYKGSGARNGKEREVLAMEGGDGMTGVRRLTPLECERLQGFPDGWTDIGEWIDSKGKKHKEADSPRYKALGNSIALPYWKVLARRITAQYDRDITMGSLFDGISGFCLAFQHCGAKPLWTSEIDEFCVAVCKKHFGDEDTGEEGDLWKYLNQ